MIEREVKILDIERNDILQKLAVLGAACVFDDEVHAVYYSLPEGQSGLLLRLRREGNRSILTLKKHISRDRVKVQEEQEVEVSDFGTAHSILMTLGYPVWMEMRKRRTRYVLPNVSFDLDKYEDGYADIPEFLEIEGPDIGTILRYAEMLGFRETDCRPWDILQVAEHYRAGCNGC